MKRLALFLLAIMGCACATAQMPVSLLDNDTVVNPAQWKTAAPIVQAGLECRQQINQNDPALRPLFPNNDTGQWHLVPPNGFSVFGLPVQSITIYIDKSGELGASYTASVSATMSTAVRAARLNDQRKTSVGSLRAGQGSRPSLTDIICTVNGWRDQEE